MVKIAAFIVTAHRWGDPEQHSYVVGANMKFADAVKRAWKEVQDRGGKYGCMLTAMDSKGNPLSTSHMLHDEKDLLALGNAFGHHYVNPNPPPPKPQTQWPTITHVSTTPGAETVTVAGMDQHGHVMNDIVYAPSPSLYQKATKPQWLYTPKASATWSGYGPMPPVDEANFPKCSRDFQDEPKKLKAQDTIGYVEYWVKQAVQPVTQYNTILGGVELKK